MTDGSYLAMWERLRKRIEDIIIIEQPAREDLDSITKILERVQKGELSLRDGAADRLLVVNIHIPCACGENP